jgi:hypothetical protein
MWLRRTHGWLGLWGAVVGLFLSFTGIMLNHRSILKIDGPHSETANVEVALPDPRPATAQDMAVWLQQRLALDRPATRVVVEPTRRLGWGDGKLWQPEQWRIGFSAPHRTITGFYWVGDSAIRVQDVRPNLLMTLNRLHKAEGVNIGWVLLIDSVAASIIVLCLSGLLLWTGLNGARLAALGIGIACPLGAGIAYWALL